MWQEVIFLAASEVKSPTTPIAGGEGVWASNSGGAQGSLYAQLPPF